LPSRRAFDSYFTLSHIETSARTKPAALGTGERACVPAAHQARQHCLVAFGLLFAAVAPVEAGTTRIIKSKGSGTFVSANFDFDHSDLSTPASYINSEGISNAGKFTTQGVNEFAPDGHTCTVPGGVAGAGTEFTLVGEVDVSRFTATGDLLFFKSTPARRVRISPRSQRPLSRSS
jgi:hypothetical protein